MSNKTLTQDIRDSLAFTVSGLGYQLVSCTLDQYNVLRLCIDNINNNALLSGKNHAIADDIIDASLAVNSDVCNGIGVEDCVLVSKHLSRYLAVEDIIDYETLEVSSAGDKEERELLNVLQ